MTRNAGIDNWREETFQLVTILFLEVLKYHMFRLRQVFTLKFYFSKPLSLLAMRICIFKVYNAATEI
jgi:hypothetical protein